ncbi:conserved hypothetical protein [Neospora caninum Liverpool]|uniref:Uncharacterized protein n=1 Tax=Neospora caninum (strain Liverpool) TaxID=572307 RepID=F0VPH7_NEOCL|nr:conserved hypothetical protein [Neospora caninum Liverpool]CBZ55623.1 conserved hypothetical protein [Neospora caninum Liverpool]CEL70365.1 TPA: hypothetical protein BN1204_060480 [Neospora caninum Liverpool]|eukprot:XP_003885651.1 conserved hypothetical protein [Neospora caninum Liverpool]
MSEKILIVDTLDRAAGSQCSRLSKVLHKLGLAGSSAGLREALAAPECKESRRIQVATRHRSSRGDAGENDTEDDKCSFGCFGPFTSRRPRPQGAASPRRNANTSSKARLSSRKDESQSLPGNSSYARITSRRRFKTRSATRARHPEVKHGTEDETVALSQEACCCRSADAGRRRGVACFEAARNTALRWSAHCRAEENCDMCKFVAHRPLSKPQLKVDGRVLKPALVTRGCCASRFFQSDIRSGYAGADIVKHKAKQVIVDAVVYVCQYSPEDAPKDVRSSNVQCIPVIVLTHPEAITREAESKLILGATPSEKIVGECPDAGSVANQMET